MFSLKLFSYHELNHLWHKSQRKRREKSKQFKGHTWLEIDPFYEALLPKVFSVVHTPGKLLERQTLVPHPPYTKSTFYQDVHIQYGTGNVKRMSNIRQPAMQNWIGNNLGLDIFNQKPEKKTHCNSFVSHC